MKPQARFWLDVRGRYPGVVIGAGAQIGDHVKIGANSAIGPGVAIGHDCEIGSNVSISHAYVGDRVVILPNAAIGQSGFGFASSATGHVKIPQLGRVIIQDSVEIGAATTIDRGALGDTVIGEGSKLDNLVQVAHNVQIGRQVMLVSQVGIAGSAAVGDFAVVGGQVGHRRSRLEIRVERGWRRVPAWFQAIKSSGGRDCGGRACEAFPRMDAGICIFSLLGRLAQRKRDDDE